MTALILYVVKFVCRGRREEDSLLEVGDLGIHGEEAYSAETFSEKIGVGVGGTGTVPSREPAPWWLPVPDPEPVGGKRVTVGAARGRYEKRRWRRDPVSVARARRREDVDA